jgi:DNA repair protein SbcD/Mre11
MRALRIAHLSDSHLGYRALARIDPATGRNQRSIDVEHGFTQAIDDILRRKVDLVLHSGDLFHHARPVYPAIGTAIRQFRRLEQAGIPTFVIGGNHDTPRLRTSGSVFFLLGMALPDTHFYGGYDEKVVPLPDLEAILTVVPHGRLTNEEPYVPFPSPNERHVLVTHGFIPGMSVQQRRPEPGEEEIDETMLDEGFSYIALGHYHQFERPRERQFAWYAGSTERIGWGDLPITPGYLLVELGEPGEEPRVEHIPVETRPMADLRVPERIATSEDGVRIADYVIEWLGGLADTEAMTRVVISGASRPVRRHAESLIRKAAGEVVWSVQVVGTTDLFALFEESAADLPTIDVLGQFETFVAREREAGNYDEPFAAAFLETGRRELEQAAHLLEAQAAAEEG